MKLLGFDLKEPRKLWCLGRHCCFSGESDTRTDVMGGVDSGRRCGELSVPVHITGTAATHKVIELTLK